MLPLQGIRIIDFCNVVMGPYATQQLAEYGAEVIKIEPPEGDDSRRTGVFTEQNMASLFLGVNRGKRSIVLDLKDPDSRPLLKQLILSADVLVHNIRPQKLQALGLAVPDVRALNPRLIYASLTGFGQDGPYGGKPAYDDIIQGMSGLAALAGRHMEGAPRYLPTIAADKTVGVMAAGAILAALVGRERHGEGCTVEVPMFESIVSYTLVEHMYGRTFADREWSMGYPRALGRWRKPFATKNGFICVMPYTDRHWRELLLETGRTDLVDDARFGTIASRSEHTDFVYESLAKLLVARSTAEWLERLEALQIPAAAVGQPEDLPQDPHLQAVDYFQHIHDPEMGTLRFPGASVLFNGYRPALSTPPRLGEHTEAIVSELAVRQGADPT